MTRDPDGLVALGIAPAAFSPPPGAVISQGRLVTAPTLAADRAAAVLAYRPQPDDPSVIRALADAADGVRIAAIRAETLASLWAYDLSRLFGEIVGLSALAANYGAGAIEAARPDSAAREAERAYRLADAVLTLQREVGAACFGHWRRSQALAADWHAICRYFDAACPCRRSGHWLTGEHWVARMGSLCWPFDVGPWRVLG